MIELDDDLQLEGEAQLKLKGLYIYFSIFHIDYRVLFCVFSHNAILPYFNILTQPFYVPRMDDVILRDLRSWLNFFFLW